MTTDRDFFVDVDPRISRAFEMMKERLSYELEQADPTTHPSMADFLTWQNEVAMQFRLIRRFKEALAAAMTEAANAAERRREATQRRGARTLQTAGVSSRV